MKNAISEIIVSLDGLDQIRLRSIVYDGATVTFTLETMLDRVEGGAQPDVSEWLRKHGEQAP